MMNKEINNIGFKVDITLFKCAFSAKIMSTHLVTDMNTHCLAR